MHTVLYQGMRLANRPAFVTRQCAGELVVLPARQDLRNHSPDGFAWGYCGSGPAQLALAVLADALQSDEAALNCYQAFKRQVIAGLKGDSWVLTQESICDWWLKGIRIPAQIAGNLAESGVS